jgi:hypothetical protein
MNIALTVAALSAFTSVLSVILPRGHSCVRDDNGASAFSRVPFASEAARELISGPTTFHPTMSKER